MAMVVIFRARAAWAAWITFLRVAGGTDADKDIAGTSENVHQLGEDQCRVHIVSECGGK